MQLPSSEKSYMPTLANVVMNGSDAKMVEVRKSAFPLLKDIL